MFGGGGSFHSFAQQRQNLPCVQWGSRHWGVAGSRTEMLSLQPDVCMRKETVNSKYGSRIVSDKNYCCKEKEQNEVKESGRWGVESPVKTLYGLMF